MRNLFSFRLRIILAFVLVSSLVGFIAIYQSDITKQAQNLFDTVAQNDVKRLRALGEIKTNIALLQYEVLLQQQTPKDQQTYREKVATTEKVIQDRITEYRTHILHTDPKAVENHEQIDTVELQSKALAQKATAIYNNTLATNSQLAIFNQEATTLIQQLDGATNNEYAQIVEKNRIVEATVAKGRTDLFIIVVLLIIASLGFGILIVMSLNRSLKKIKGGAQRIANGDFSQTIQVHSRDEIGELGQTFNQMADRLKESYSRLALEKQRDEALLESMGEGMVAVDESNKVVLVNSVATQLLELESRTAAVGKSIFETYKIYDAKLQPIKDTDQPVYITLKTGHPSGDAFTFQRKDNKKILLGINSYPVTLNQKTVGAIMILRDVTKEKEVDRMKTEFISLASHQLRTPLSAIKWFTEMLISGDAGKLTPEQLDFAQNVSDSAERMIELVNSLLNISRIESGRIIIDPRPTDLKQLVTGIVNDLKAKTEERKQTLIISVHKDLPKINLDPRLISQVYLNLLTNAIKYTPKGGEITVLISKKDDQVISQVTDNGYGIPKSEQGKIFQKFFRAGNIIKVETDGTGLGLYLIKAIVESSGGKIWFESQEGKGTSFWFTLPLSGMKAKEGEVTLDA